MRTLLKSKIYILLSVIFTGCSYGQLQVICETESALKEISAIEYDADRDLFWVIQDSGNSNELIGIDKQGRTKQTIELTGYKNKDWEDVTKDDQGNIYIGDFGNNDKSRKKYKIYKVNASDLDKSQAKAILIEFKLPKDHKEQDFEGFFVLREYFYVFSKSDKKTIVYKVPNQEGEHKAKKIGAYEFKGKNNKITSAAISPDEKTVVLLNGSKLWKLSGFKEDDFFSGQIEAMKFNHKSQKEGIGFITNTQVVISDERNVHGGGMFYTFQLK